jgi:hypothetical protein
MNLVRNPVIEKSVQIAADELDRRHAGNLFPICLPQRTKECLAGVTGLGSDSFRVFRLLEVCSAQLIFACYHGPTGVGIHYVPKEWTTPGDLVGMPPEIAQLGPLSRNHEYHRTWNLRLPSQSR